MQLSLAVPVLLGIAYIVYILAYMRTIVYLNVRLTTYLRLSIQTPCRNRSVWYRVDRYRLYICIYENHVRCKHAAGNVLAAFFTTTAPVLFGVRRSSSFTQIIRLLHYPYPSMARNVPASTACLFAYCITHVRNERITWRAGAYARFKKISPLKSYRSQTTIPHPPPLRPA